MKMSNCKSYDDLPLFLNASLVAQVLGVSISTAYELMNEPDHLLYLGGQDVETAWYISAKANKPMTSILQMPLDGAWLFARGENPGRFRNTPWKVTRCIPNWGPPPARRPLSRWRTSSRLSYLCNAQYHQHGLQERGRESPAMCHGSC